MRERVEIILKEEIHKKSEEKPPGRQRHVFEWKKEIRTPATKKEGMSDSIDWGGDAWKGLRSNLPTDHPLRKIAKPPELPRDTDAQVERKHIIITRIVPESNCFFRDFAVADVLNFSRLAKELHEALGENEPPEKFYRVLQSLHREDEAIERLYNAYQGIYGNNKVLEKLQDKCFTGARREYALQLINEGKEGTEQEIGHVPSCDADFERLAERINKALTDEKGVTPENIYAALTPLQRNTELLVRLDKTYRRQHKKGLRLHLESTLKKISLDSLDYTQYLIGDRKLEVKAVSKREAECLFQAISKSRFVKKDGMGARLPNRNPIRDCQNRAHVVSQILKEMGYPQGKVFAVSGPMGERHLQLSTYYAGDSKIHEKPLTLWWFHTATYMPVLKNVKLVMDCSVFGEQAGTIDEWAAEIKPSQSDIRTIQSLSELKAIMKEHCFGYPVDPMYLITVESNQLYVTPVHEKQINHYTIDHDGITDSTVHKHYEQAVEKGGLIKTKEAEPSHYIAAVLREYYWDRHKADGLDADDIGAVFRYIDVIDPDVRSRFPCHFPMLYSSFKGLLSTERSQEFEKLFCQSEEDRFQHFTSLMDAYYERYRSKGRDADDIKEIKGYIAATDTKIRSQYRNSSDYNVPYITYILEARELFNE